jgi:hypothetical protein
MATIKQITKQIETATKRIADFDRKIAMYTERRDKAIAAANKKSGLNICVDDIIVKENTNGRYTWKEYSLPASIRDAIGFEASFKITNACDYINDNTKNKGIEERNLARLQSELAALEEKAKADADNYDNALDAALRSAMADFRVVWFERMMTWHGKHFDIIQERTPVMKDRRARAINAKQYFNCYGTYSKHRRTCSVIDAIIGRCNEVIYDAANNYPTRDSYLADMKEELERSWERGIVNLTKKCQVYGVDQSKVSTCAPNMTSKGFEVIIQDGKPRVIHARIIWAAEYSDIVEPHIRYIVTERTVK